MSLNATSNHTDPEVGSPSPTTTNIQPTKNIKWTPDNEMILVEWCDIAKCYKWLHTKCHNKLSVLHAWFTIPTIVFSTISGTASFAQSSLPQSTQLYSPMVIGSINILIGIFTTIQQYLKISERNELHRVSGLLWDKFARNISIELAKAPDERIDAGHFIKSCRQEFDRLMETSPSISQNIVDDFNRTFKGIVTKEQQEKFAKKKQQRFQELRKPDICDVIIPCNEKRHVWYKTRFGGLNPYRENTLASFYSAEGALSQQMLNLSEIQTDGFGVRGRRPNASDIPEPSKQIEHISGESNMRKSTSLENKDDIDDLERQYTNIHDDDADESKQI